MASVAQLEDATQGHFSDIPGEVIEIILAKLDPYSLCSISRTSRTLQLLARQDHLWSKFGSTVMNTDLLIQAAQECLAIITHLPPQVFSVDVHEERSQKFPITCHPRKAANSSIPHVRMLLGRSDGEDMAQEISSQFQERILQRRGKAGKLPTSPFDAFSIARADRGEIRLGLCAPAAIRVIQRQLRKEQALAGYNAQAKLDKFIDVILSLTRHAGHCAKTSMIWTNVSVITATMQAIIDGHQLLASEFHQSLDWESLAGADVVASATQADINLMMTLRNDRVSRRFHLWVRGDSLPETELSHFEMLIATLQSLARHVQRYMVLNEYRLLPASVTCDIDEDRAIDFMSFAKCLAEMGSQEEGVGMVRWEGPARSQTTADAMATSRKASQGRHLELRVLLQLEALNCLTRWVSAVCEHQERSCVCHK